MDKILYGVAAIVMIVVIAYGGSWLFQFLKELFKNSMANN